MRDVDLSTRRVPVSKSPIPSFADRQYTLGQLTASGQIFRPNCACSVVWVLVQLVTASTIQLLVDGVPVTAPYALNANAFVRFHGLLVPNNSVLSLSLAPSVVVNFEVAWVKEFRPELIAHDTTINNPSAGGGGGGGTVAQGTAAALGGAWPVELTDGVAILGTPAAPVRTDPTGTTPQPVTGTVAAVVAGSVAVTNLPATQPVSGSVAVTNLPATQPVSGSVAVTNLPATQPVSGSVAATEADGADATQGSIADSAVLGDAPGTQSAKLRGINAGVDAIRQQRLQYAVAALQVRQARSQMNNQFIPYPEIPEFLGSY